MFVPAYHQGKLREEMTHYGLLIQVLFAELIEIDLYTI